MKQRFTPEQVGLHDCRAKKMSFEQGVLSFYFPDGIWVLPKSSDNPASEALRTKNARVDFSIVDADPDEIEIYLFRKNRRGNIIREDWKPDDFAAAVNAGEYQVEFLYTYQGYQSFLFKCWVWFEKAPWHAECEIILRTDGGSCEWDEIETP